MECFSAGLRCELFNLHIFDLIINGRFGCEIAHYIISAEFGIKVQNKNHRGNRSMKIDEYCGEVSELFTDK